MRQSVSSVVRGQRQSLSPASPDINFHLVNIFSAVVGLEAELAGCWGRESMVLLLEKGRRRDGFPFALKPALGRSLDGEVQRSTHVLSEERKRCRGLSVQEKPSSTPSVMERAAEWSAAAWDGCSSP